MRDKSANMSQYMHLQEKSPLASNGLTLRSKLDMNWVDCPIDKEKISITRHRFMNGGTTKARSNQEVVVESGECNVQFKFKLVGLERINKIFDEFSLQVSTNNRAIDPRN